MDSRSDETTGRRDGKLEKREITTRRGLAFSVFRGRMGLLGIGSGRSARGNRLHESLDTSSLAILDFGIHTQPPYLLVVASHDSYVRFPS